LARRAGRSCPHSIEIDPAADALRGRKLVCDHPPDVTSKAWIAGCRPHAADRTHTNIGLPRADGAAQGDREGGGAHSMNVPAGPPSRLDAPARDAYTRTRFGARARLSGARS